MIAVGTQFTSEAINFFGSGNTVINYGLIRGGPSSAIFFENVNTAAASPRNKVDNFSTIELIGVGVINPTTGTQAVGSFNNVGIDFINESGAKVVGNLVFQGGSDRVILNPTSSISGDLDGGGGINSLTLNASGVSVDTFAGQLQNFQSLDKTGTGTWTLTGAIGNNTSAGSAPLAVSVVGGKLVLTGNNTNFNGSAAINPGTSLGVAGSDLSATLEARTQSLPPLITNHGTLLLNQFSPDGNQSRDGAYAGVVQGTGALIKIGDGTAILNSDNTFTGPTTVRAGALAIGDAGHASAVLSGGGTVTVGPGATLGGFGRVAGSVMNSGTVAAGNALGAFAASPSGVFTIEGTLRNQAVVKVDGASIGNTLLVRGDYISAGGTLTLNSFLNAGGPLSNQFTDRLLIGGSASGSTAVRVTGSGSGALTSTGRPTASDGISLIQVAGASSATAFTLSGGYVNNGTPFQYRLVAYGPGSVNGSAAASQRLLSGASPYWDYRLQSAFVSPTGPVEPPVIPPDPNMPILPVVERPQVAPQVPGYVTTPTVLFNLGIQDLDSLHRRLGEIRDSRHLEEARGGEVFARTFGGRLAYTSGQSFQDYGFSSTQHFSAVQVGINRTVVESSGGTLRMGWAGTAAKLTFTPYSADGESSGEFHSKTVSGIATWQSDAGWYLDGIIAAGFFNGQVAAATRTPADIKGASLAASV